MLVGQLFKFSWVGVGRGKYLYSTSILSSGSIYNRHMLFVYGTMSPARVDVPLVYKMT